MERDQAIRKLARLKGENLHDVAARHGVTVTHPNGKVNKGWAGHAIERHLGLQINSSRSPNFGSWELKSVPLKRLKNGSLAFKETMAITMIDPPHVARAKFADSHLLTKLKRFVCVTRVVGEVYSDPTYIHSVVSFDLEKRLYDAVKKDYDLVRRCIRDPDLGFDALTGRMGVYIQPRTKGAGHGSTTRSFYARKEFLAEFIDLNQSI